MPFQVSPGVQITERDLTAVVPNVATSIGGMVGQFGWGPCEERVRISSQNELVELFGEPEDNNSEYFWSAANYLEYGNNLILVRSINDSAGTTGLNSSVNSGVAGTNAELIENTDAFETKKNSLTDLFYAKYPGVKGDSLEILAIDSAGWEAATGTNNVTRDASRTARAAGTATEQQLRDLKFLDNFVGKPGTSADIQGAGGLNDELHVIVIDKGGVFTGVIDEVLETWSFVSKARDAKRVDGSSNYVRNVLANESRYAYAASRSAFTSLAVAALAEGAVGGADVGSVKTSTFENLNAANGTTIGGKLTAGSDGNDLVAGDLIDSYDLFDNADIVDLSLLMAGGSSGLATGATSVAQKIIQIADQRKDCVAFVSPSKDAVVGKTNPSDITDDIIADKTAIGNSNYGVMDSAWKYQYDQYRDIFVFTPMNADVAGLCARTDLTDDPWYSPAGYSRGAIRNIVKPSWEPRLADRDELYKSSVNPFITQIGAGVILYGDKTMQINPTAFDRINVRRLFIVIEKAISIAARQMLFEFNDEFTRSQFVSLITPYLREVQGRRGITDFQVICDSTNNTGQVIDSNNFVGDIFIKPTRSINFIQLNFVATRSDVSFSEINA